MADLDVSQEEDLAENTPAVSGGRCTLDHRHQGMTGMAAMTEMTIMIMITRGTGEEGETEGLRDRE
jgi:hypothetical protein